jgi:hypothetical protein
MRCAWLNCWWRAWPNPSWSVSRVSATARGEPTLTRRKASVLSQELYEALEVGTRVHTHFGTDYPFVVDCWYGCRYPASSHPLTSTWATGATPGKTSTLTRGAGLLQRWARAAGMGAVAVEFSVP